MAYQEVANPQICRLRSDQLLGLVAGQPFVANHPPSQFLNIARLPPFVFNGKSGEQFGRRISIGITGRIAGRARPTIAVQAAGRVAGEELVDRELH